ncbi:hypothetical protein [Halobellus ordinarius]|uniref:hypothetical protein n=1 Tax=Halobellus ordinarius TaxID=3075120 RepID=UPI00288091FF|nr:hypothetical protein [Halobellus sp. ZY16]
MSQTDDAADPPRAWVESFHESEAEVRDVLDGIREQHLLGETEAVRERLRAFGEAEPGIFRLIALVTIDIETVYDDLAEQYDDGEAPTEELRALGREYQRLSDEIELVFAEQTQDLRNPMPQVKCAFRYSESIKLPRLGYDVYSGDVRLCEFAHPPSQALMFARTLLASTRELLQRVDANDDEIAANERERLAYVYESLTDELEALDGYVTQGTDESPAETNAQEVYDDWSFN